MADTAVAITAGTGTNIDTRTEGTNGHHRQVVVLGDPATNAGVAPVDATAGLKVDLGADNDITGTVTANLGATDNAVLDAIEVDTTTIAGDTTTIAGDTTSIDAKIPALGQALAAASTPVVLTAAQVTTLTPPAAISGFATSAKQDTIIGHVDGIEGLLTTIDSDTGTIATEVAGLLTDTELRATPVPVSGTVTANLSATDNAVLDDIASDTEAIKTSLAGTITVTGGGGGTEYTEDVATANPIVGTATMIERDDALTTVTPVEGDNIGLRGTAEGALWTQDFNSDAILADTTTIAGDTTSIDSKTPALGQALAAASVPVILPSATITTLTPPAAITGFATSANQLADGHNVTVDNSTGAAAVNIQDGGNTITVDGTVAVTNADLTTIAGAVAATHMQVDVVGALPAGTAAIGKLAANSGVDIGDVTLTAGTALVGKVSIDQVTANANEVVTKTGSVTAATLSAETTKVIGTVNIAAAQTLATVTALTGGGVAHDSADSGNPHKIGFKAFSPDGTTPGTAVAENDRTDAKADLDGRQYVNDEHPRWGSYHEDSTSALTDASVAADPGDGFQIVITNIIVSTGAATALNFFLEEGASKIFGPIYLEAVAGRGFCTPAGFKKHVTASTAVTITTSAAIAHSVDIQYIIQAV